MNRNSSRFKWCGSTNWSPSELSIFQQAGRILELQGIHVEIETGMTDEGDPWLVFCDSSSEWLCHFARVGSKYVACVPFENVGTTGTALTDVLDDFFSTWPRGVALWALQLPVSHEKI